MDIIAYNRRAWDRAVEQGNPWTVPVGPEVIAAARRGEWQVVHGAPRRSDSLPTGFRRWPVSMFSVWRREAGNKRRSWPLGERR